MLLFHAWNYFVCSLYGFIQYQLILILSIPHPLVATKEKKSVGYMREKEQLVFKEAMYTRWVHLMVGSVCNIFLGGGWPEPVS